MSRQVGILREPRGKFCCSFLLVARNERQNSTPEFLRMTSEKDLKVTYSSAILFSGGNKFSGSGRKWCKSSINNF